MVDVIFLNCVVDVVGISMSERTDFLGAISPVVGTLAGGLFDRFAMAKTRRDVNRAEDKAWDRENIAWNRNNAYNHPAAQMSRLREAGLNPNLLYQQPVNVPAQPVHSQMHQRVPTGQNIDKLQGYLALQNMYSQGKNIKAQTESSKAQAENSRAQAALYRSRIPLNERDLEFNPSDPTMLKLISRAPSTFMSMLNSFSPRSGSLSGESTKFKPSQMSFGDLFNAFKYINKRG